MKSETTRGKMGLASGPKSDELLGKKAESVSKEGGKMGILLQVIIIIGKRPIWKQERSWGMILYLS